jgi:hypothetical protein
MALTALVGNRNRRMLLTKLEIAVTMTAALGLLTVATPWTEAGGSTSAGTCLSISDGTKKTAVAQPTVGPFSLIGLSSLSWQIPASRACNPVSD